MRVMVLVKANQESEAGVMPSKELLTEMGKFNEELVKAGVMLAGEGLHPTSKAKRVKFDSGKRTVILDENLAPSLGLQKDTGEIVRSVVAGGPAARAGLQQGDVIVRVGNQQVTPEQTVSYLIANTQVGSRVPLEIIRGGRRQTIQVTVGERPTEQELARLGGGGGTTQGTPDGGQAVTPQRALGLSLASTAPVARAKKVSGAPPV